MAFGYSITFTFFPFFFIPSQYLFCQSFNGSNPPINTKLFGNFTPDMSPDFGPNTFAAGWSRSEPSGRNAFQHQSVRHTDTIGDPASWISDSVLSSPPKYGCIGISPRIFKFRNLNSLALAATWWARLPPALSPAMKQRVRLECSGGFSSMNLSTSKPSLYWEGHRCSGARR